MIGEILFWLVVFGVTAGMLFMNVFTLILYSDLEADHINPVELCERVNGLVLPEYLGQLAVAAMLLLRGFWLAALLNVPILYWNGRRWLDGKHLLDNTSIFTYLPVAKRHSRVKLGFFLVMFFFYLYRQVECVVHAGMR